MADRIADAVRRVNGKLPTIERIRHFAATEPFTIENGLLTPTMKVKRRVAIETRHDAIEALSGKRAAPPGGRPRTCEHSGRILTFR